jgi:hypothetical protein
MSSQKKLLPVQPAHPDAHGLGRRDVIQMLLGAVGAGLAVPGLAPGHPLQHHLSDLAKVADADAKATAADWKPEFLDAHQFQTLQTLAERIVPGASKAKTAEFIDQLLAVDTQAGRRNFLNALGAFEGRALERVRRPWKALGAADQDAILIEASTMPSGRPPEGYWTKGKPIEIARKPAGEVRLTLRDHFDLLKGWIAGAYYSSEIGMRELGWTGNVFYERFPGCEHPGGHP